MSAIAPAALPATRPSSATRWLTPALGDALCAALLLWLVFFTLSSAEIGLLQDAGTGYHIRVGDYIRTHAAVPQTDFLSFSKPNAPFYAWEWICGVLYSWLYAASGMKGMILLHAGVIVAAAYLSLRHMIRRGTDALVGIALMHLYIGVSSIHYLARPHLFTLLFMAIGVWLLDQDRHRASRAVWWLVPLTALWANMHAGFFGFLASLWIFAIGTAAEGFFDRNFAPAKRYSLLALACSAASLLNPYGWHEHIHLLQFTGQRWIVELVEEYQPPRFQSTAGHYFEVLFCCAFVLAAYLAWKRKWAWTLVILAWTHLSLTSVRHVPILVIILAPQLGPVLTQLWHAATRQSRRSSLLGTLASLGRDHAIHLGRISVFALAIPLILWIAPVDWPTTFPDSRYPVDLIEKHADYLATRRVFTTDGWADYLTFRSYPRQGVFYDGRSDFFGQAIADEYTQMLNGRPAWSSLLDKWNIETALLPNESALASLLRERSSAWRVADHTPQATLFERQPSRP